MWVSKYLPAEQDPGVVWFLSREKDGNMFSLQLPFKKWCLSISHIKGKVLMVYIGNKDIRTNSPGLRTTGVV